MTPFYFQYLNVQMLQVLNDTPFNQSTGGGNSTVIDSNIDQQGILAMIYPVISSLYFNVIFMGLCASIISFTITLIIERAGSRVGGIIGSIPTAVVPSTLGFAMDALFKFGQDNDARQHVMTRGFYTIPIGTFMTAVFLLCWKVIPPFIDCNIVGRWRGFVASKIIKHTEKHAYCNNSDDSKVLGSGELTKEFNEVITNSTDEFSVKDHTNEIVLSEKDESTVESSPITSSILDESSRSCAQEDNELNPHYQPTFQIKMWQLLGGDSLIKVMSALLVCCLGVGVWTVMASTYMLAISFIQWRDEIHIAISALCFVATLVLALYTSWTYKVYKPMNQAIVGNQTPEKKKFKKSRLFIFALRIGLPFCLVSVSVLLNAMQLTLLAGLFASFPTIYMTTLFTLWIGNEDESLAVDSVGPMMLGSCSVSLYAMIACPTMFHWNLLAGAFVAYGCAIVGINIPAFFYLRWRKIVGEKRIKAQLFEAQTNSYKLQSLKLQDFSPVQGYDMSNMEYTHDDIEFSGSFLPSSKISISSIGESKSVDSLSSFDSNDDYSIERTQSCESFESVISDI